jgi:hypothetical protein
MKPLEFGDGQELRESEDQDLRALFLARAAVLPSFDDELDFDDVLARADRTSSSQEAVVVALRAATILRGRTARERGERNGVWVSGMTSLAAAACFWLSLGSGTFANESPSLLVEPSNENVDPSALVCPIPNDRVEGPNACILPASLHATSSRPRSVLASHDFGVSDARSVTCTANTP